VKWPVSTSPTSPARWWSAKDKRITARHTRELEQSGTTHISVPEDFLIGRVLARNMVDADTGEIIAKANEELTEALLKKLRSPGQGLQCLYTNELDQGAYISQTLRIRRDGRTSSPPAWPSTA
jgi:DNA-directed RNA polymerase subunit beta